MPDMPLYGAADGATGFSRVGAMFLCPALCDGRSPRRFAPGGLKHGLNLGRLCDCAIALTHLLVAWAAGSVLGDAVL